MKKRKVYFVRAKQNKGKEGSIKPEVRKHKTRSQKSNQIYMLQSVEIS